MDEQLEHISNEQDDNGLSLSNESKGYLAETAGWTKFLAIIGFVMMGLLVLMGLFAGSIFSALGAGDEMPFPPFLFGLIYIIIGLIYFFPILYLFRFSTKVKEAIQQKNEALLTAGFSNLKSHYKFVGILVVAVLALYAVGIVVGLAGMAMG